MSMIKPPWMMTEAEWKMERQIREAAEKESSKKSFKARNTENQKKGTKGEGLITSSLLLGRTWNYKLVNAGHGTLFDKIIIPPGGGYAVEVKTRKQPIIEYSKIEKNERDGLDDFMCKVGQQHAYIIGIWMITGETKRAFLIPWHEVRDAVCSGARGSINMLDFPELPKQGSGWNLSCMWEGKK